MLNKIFTQHITVSYQDYLHQENIPDNGVSMLTFLMRKEVISTSAMRQFVVPLEIDKMMKSGMNKSKSVLELSTSLDYSESQIYAVLKKDDINLRGF